MRILASWLWLVVVLSALAADVYRQEQRLTSGEIIYLKLQNHDLTKDNTILLRYDIANEFSFLAPKQGYMVVRLDARHVATFKRFHQREPVTSDERLLRFEEQRYSSGFNAEVFHIAEGSEARYESAEYGMVRLQPDGSLVLVDLCDARLRPLSGPAPKTGTTPR